MLYHLLYGFLRDEFVGFNVFRYITFRTAFAALTALMISFILGPWLIDRMRRIKAGQYIREAGAPGRCGRRPSRSTSASAATTSSPERMITGEVRPSLAASACSIRAASPWMAARNGCSSAT